MIMPRRKALYLKWRGLPDWSRPFTPVHRTWRLSAAFGATSRRSARAMRPPAMSPMVGSASSPYPQRATLQKFQGKHCGTRPAQKAQGEKTRECNTRAKMVTEVNNAFARPFAEASSPSPSTEHEPRFVNSTSVLQQKTREVDGGRWRSVLKSYKQVH